MRDTSRYLKHLERVKTNRSQRSEAGEAIASCEALSDVVENFRERGRLIPLDGGWSGGAYGQPMTINCVLCSWNLRLASLNVPTVPQSQASTIFQSQHFGWKSQCAALCFRLALIVSIFDSPRLLYICLGMFGDVLSADCCVTAWIEEVQSVKSPWSWASAPAPRGGVQVAFSCLGPRLEGVFERFGLLESLKEDQQTGNAGSWEWLGMAGNASWAFESS